MLPGNEIVDLQPAAESQIKISSLPAGPPPVEFSGSLDDDPIVITSTFQIAQDYSLLTPASVDTADAYGNVIDDVPNYGTSANVGTAITADRGTTIRFDADDVGQTATVTVSSGSLPDRHLEIGNIVAATLAGTLMCELEGPAIPLPGGEAIVQVYADGTFAPDKDISVDIVDASSVADSQLRDLSGGVLLLPATGNLDGTADDMIRLVVSAPDAGDVVLEVGDASGDATLLDTGTCTISFGAECTPVVTVTPASATIDAGGTQEFTASTSCTEGGDPLNTPVYTWEISAAGGTGGTGGTGGGACSGGSISATTLNSVGLYTAPSSVSADCSDGVKATDTANDNAEGTANVTVSGGGTTTTPTTVTTTIAPDDASLTVRPGTLRRGRVLPRFHLLRLNGNNTSFSRDSVVSVSPAGEVSLGIKLRLGQVILQTVRVLSGDSGASITVTVTTGPEEVSDTVDIEMGIIPLAD
jgi:hypothetical protein